MEDQRGPSSLASGSGTSMVKSKCPDNNSSRVNNLLLCKYLVIILTLLHSETMGPLTVKNF